jgi:hypothetical protein
MFENCNLNDWNELSKLIHDAYLSIKINKFNNYRGAVMMAFVREWDVVDRWYLQDLTDQTHYDPRHTVDRKPSEQNYNNIQPTPS